MRSNEVSSAAWQHDVERRSGGPPGGRAGLRAPDQPSLREPRGETVVAASVVGLRMQPDGSQTWPGVGFQRMDQPCENVPSFTDMFCQTRCERLKPRESLVVHLLRMIHVRTLDAAWGVTRTVSTSAQHAVPPTGCAIYGTDRWPPTPRAVSNSPGLSRGAGSVLAGEPSQLPDADELALAMLAHLVGDLPIHVGLPGRACRPRTFCRSRDSALRCPNCEFSSGAEDRRRSSSGVAGTKTY